MILVYCFDLYTFLMCISIIWSLYHVLKCKQHINQHNRMYAHIASHRNRNIASGKRVMPQGLPSLGKKNVPCLRADGDGSETAKQNPQRFWNRFVKSKRSKFASNICMHLLHLLHLFIFQQSCSSLGLFGAKWPCVVLLKTLQQRKMLPEGKG